MFKGSQVERSPAYLVKARWAQVPPGLQGLKMISVLFVRQRSVYKRMGVDCFDEQRDAMEFCGDWPVVAHPPCRAWGRLKYFAKPNPGEKDLARFAVRVVRENGGVLEHPAGSSLWRDMNLPRPHEGFDVHGGFTLPISQLLFGHRGEKATWLYVCGVSFEDLPKPQLNLAMVEKSVQSMGKAERESTPDLMASWLVEVAASCKRRSERLI